MSSADKVNTHDRHTDVKQRLTKLVDNPQLGESDRERARAWCNLLDSVKTWVDAPLVLALFAEVGRGKSTLIAAATGLRLEGVGDEPSAWSVLPVGDGRTTLGETRVEFEDRPDVQLEVEPIPSDELARELGVLARDLWDEVTGANLGIGSAAGEELYTLLRTWLVPNAADPREELRKIARAEASVKTLEARLRERVDLPERSHLLRQTFARDVSGLRALKVTLADLMSGALPDGPAPRTVVLRVPRNKLGQVVDAVVDTQGIDTDANLQLMEARPDLHRLLRDPNTLPVLCSGFESAPDMTTTELAKLLAKDAAGTGGHSSLRVVIVDRLRHQGDVASRQRKATDRQGQCEDRLRREGLVAKVVVIDARGEADGVSEPLRNWGSEAREARTKLWEQVLGAAEGELRGFADTEFASSARRADLELWWVWDTADSMRPALCIDGISLLTPLILHYMKHWSHLHATVRRRGRYRKLDLATLGASGAAALAIAPFRKALATMEADGADGEYDSPSSRLAEHRTMRHRQFLRVLEAYGTAVYEYWHQILTSYFASPESDALWQWCESRWGQGAGYVEAVQQRLATEASQAQVQRPSPVPQLRLEELPPRPDLLSLARIELQNFRAVEDQTLQFEGKVTVVVGDNGCGKTTWLEAASIALGALLPGVGAGPAPGLLSSDIRQAIHEVGGVPDRQYRLPLTVKLEANVDGNMLTWSRGIEAVGPDSQAVVSEQGGLQVVAGQIGEEVRNHFVRQLPVLAYYGTQRLWPSLLVPNTARRDVGSRLDGYRDCLDAGSTHQHMLEWMRHFTLVELQRKKPVLQLRAIERAVVTCVGDATRFHYDLALEELQLTMRDGTRLSFRMLSDGYRNVVAMVADIAWRASVLNPQLMAEASRLAEGVVLIDEIDLHLHPKWQRRVLADLRRAFPRLQFIATTHSPFIIQSLAAGQLVNLDPNALPAAYADESPEDIAENIMGVDVPQRSERRRQAAKAAQEYYRLLDKVPAADDRELETLRFELDRLLAPYSDNQAFVALLSRKRLLAEGMRP